MGRDGGEVVRDQTRGVYGRRAKAADAGAAPERKGAPQTAATGDTPGATVEVEVQAGMADAGSAVVAPASSDPAPTAEFEVWSDADDDEEA